MGSDQIRRPVLPHHIISLDIPHIVHTPISGCLDPIPSVFFKISAGYHIVHIMSPTTDQVYTAHPKRHTAHCIVYLPRPVQLRNSKTQPYELLGCPSAIRCQPFGSALRAPLHKVEAWLGFQATPGSTSRHKVNRKCHRYLQLSTVHPVATEATTKWLQK